MVAAGGIGDERAVKRRRRSPRFRDPVLSLLTRSSRVTGGSLKSCAFGPKTRRLQSSAAGKERFRRRNAIFCKGFASLLSRQPPCKIVCLAYVLVSGMVSSPYIS